MSKAILVMDMPEQCKDCDAYVCYKQYAGDPGDVFCGVKHEEVNGDEKPDWCPLRELPEKQEDLPTNIYREGWNACINRILKGSEENEVD